MTPAAALDDTSVARAALVDSVGEEVVGDLLDRVVESDGVEGASVTTYLFESRQDGYPGWRWAATLVRVGDAEPTVDDVVLLPGSGAIVAPAWVPWRERIRPGDLSPGDILPTDEDDARLVPTYLAGDASVDKQLATIVTNEIGLGRSRVLSTEGRDAAMQRWYDGEHGPKSLLAQSSTKQCWTCGFLVRLDGPLSGMFGVCANEYANDDGQVVSFDHGCGAHSEAQLRRKQLPVPIGDPTLDTVEEDLEVF